MNKIIPPELRRELEQSAFSAYVDAAQSREHPSAHDRLSHGSRSAVAEVVGILIFRGWVRAPLTQEAVHGTKSGYEAGCRCEFCRDASNLHERAVRRWTGIQGDNKVRTTLARQNQESRSA